MSPAIANASTVERRSVAALQALRLRLGGFGGQDAQHDLPSFGSASAAVARISSMLAGFRASGRHRSVTIDRPSTRMPAWTATITSGTVDMPTTSAPMVRRKRYSARVSRFGPVTAT